MPEAKPQRTARQNRALHLWFRMVADELNASGYDMQHVLKKRVSVPWSDRLVKEVIWRPMQRVILHKKSTTMLRKQEDIDLVYNVLNRWLGENFGLHVEWPHFEEGDYEKITSSQ